MRQLRALAVKMIPVFMLLLPVGLAAQVMQSTNYSIEFDSVNSAGDRSSSASFILEDTVGEIATGESGSANFGLKAGYQQMNGSSISLSSENDVVLSSIDGLVGGAGTGSGTWTVITDSTSGYELSVKASTTPALQSGTDSFDDYTPAGSDPDYTFSVDAASSEFGYSPEGDHVADRFLDNGAACNTGSLETADACWDGFSTSSEVVSHSTSSNHPSGTETTLKFHAESGANHLQDSGAYQATITLTAVVL